METLYGGCSENCAGYCKRHCCGITVRQIKSRNCLGKQCYYLVKNEDHAWWAQRERTKQKRKNRKEALANMCKMYGL